MKIIFICGLGGDAGMTYVDSLRSFCIEHGHQFYAPKMPSFEDGITYDKYKSSFNNLLESEKFSDFNDCIIIAQSAGTNFIVKYFSENPLNICGYISCAGFRNPADKKISNETKEKLKVLDTFYPSKADYKNFKKLKFKKFSIFGGKDCFFTKRNLKKYARAIGSVEVFDKNGLHGTISENVQTHSLLHKVLNQNF